MGQLEQATATDGYKKAVAPAADCLAVTPDKVGTADVGIVGIGVMGSNLALNMLSRGFTVAVWNLDTAVAELFVQTNAVKFGADKVVGGKTYEDFKSLLKTPRKVLILVTAGKATDSVIDNLARVLEKDDIVVDTGNAHFKDQSRRASQLEAQGLRFLGMGISGGAEGARKGPAFFPGGTRSVWEDVRPIVEAAAAKASDGRPCVTMCGVGGAGSCVKMYHNAGEYAVLQIWAEAYATMRGLGLGADRIQQVLKEWKARGPLSSYMLDITHEVAGCRDKESTADAVLVDATADMIGSKGTGVWSVQEALEVGVPVPSLAQAVIARQMSMVRPERVANAARLPTGALLAKPESEEVLNQWLEDLYWAVYLSMIASYAQMFQALRAVDKAHKLEICGNLPRIISTFRAGCILQGAMLEPMTKAFEAEPDIPNLICGFREEIKAGLPGMRAACARLALGGEPVPVIQSSLTYIVTMSLSLIQSAQVVSLQRDVFGRHGFKKLAKLETKSGADGTAEVTGETFNADWPEMVP
jgi:6-phosphogluconate dehydrogenase